MLEFFLREKVYEFSNPMIQDIRAGDSAAQFQKKLKYREFNMNQKMMSTVWIAFILIVGSACSTLDGEGLPACEKQGPPKKSFVLESHGVALLVFPEKMEKNYTGCRQIWFATGELFEEIKIINGKVLSVEIIPPDKPPVRCRFDRLGSLIEGSEKKCLPQEKWF